MVREPRTPQMDEMMKSMEGCMRQIREDGKQLGKARSIDEMVELSRRINAGIQQLDDAGKRLRQMRRERSGGAEGEPN